EGRLLKDSDEEDKAIAAFKRALTIGRGFQPEANTGLGLLYKDRAEVAGGSGDYEAEKSNYEQATKYLAVAVEQLGSAPDAIVVYQILGLIYERQQQYKEAIALYENFLRIFPNTSEAGAVQSFIVQIKKQMSEPK
ncbi:MAG TPA: tetratricopeptide repeat protein, partial [Pyrinomonadaceae bacterium]|nr:tetratricopeptide repeat protein [Pyrinomonadaceae bacterium]